jgi:hypothetical protein
MEIHLLGLPTTAYPTADLLLKWLLREKAILYQRGTGSSTLRKWHQLVSLPLLKAKK